MPELPEVQTTVSGLQAKVIGLTITAVWTNYNSPYFKGSETIKDPSYFAKFRKIITGHKIVSVKRRAKNILINLDNNQTILVHMKMTGHLLYGLYRFEVKNKKDPWQPIEPESLKDPFNKRVRFLITFDNGRHLALSDTRKFAKVTLVETEKMNESVHLRDLGPEPLESSFTLAIFQKRLLLRPQAKIKQALTDQTLMVGIGNIYADESLWRAAIHPTRQVSTLNKKELLLLFRAIKQTLSKGIDLGGDSMSDYRNVHGLKGAFQEKHRAYKRTHEPCSKKGCKGFIKRMVLGGRATHFCPKHQK